MTRRKLHDKLKLSTPLNTDQLSAIMHANSIKNLRPWPKGVSGHSMVNRLPEDLRVIKSLSGIEITKLISKYARMTLTELKASQADPKLSTIDHALIKTFQLSIEHGDFTRLSFLLDRCIGKVPIMIEDDEDLEEREALQKLSMHELLTLVKQSLPEES